MGDGEPVKIFEDRGDVVPGFGVGEESGCCILNQLESIDEGGVDAVKEGVAVVQTGGDEGVDECFGSGE